MVTKKKSLKKEFPLPKWFYIAIIALVVSVIGALVYGKLYLDGWPAYNSAMRECNGTPPVVLQTGIFTKDGYILPGDKDYTPPFGDGPLSYNRYYCTEADAIKDGLKHRQQS